MVRYWTICFFVILAVVSTTMIQGCGRGTLGGAAIGAAGVGAAYEYQNKRQMDRLNEDFQAGRISRDEYDRRKRDIESGSIIY